MRLDEIGYWSEIKLDIIRRYAAEYSKILSKQPRLEHLYIDAFAGAGTHISRATGQEVPGSPLQALSIASSFHEYHFIDLDRNKIELLRTAIQDHPLKERVHLHAGDCNEVLLSEVLPRARRDQWRRALCVLDPYGLDLSWQVVETAGHMRSVELFLNFPLMDMNRNVLWRNPEKVAPAQAERMTRSWGSDEWRHIAYSTQPDLFGTHEEKEPNEAVAGAYRQRLIEVAGFRYVPEPLPMRNTRNAVVYYLFFASHNQVGDKIARYILDKYRTRRG
jgi:three-Cys-motif partner protein